MDWLAGPGLADAAQLLAAQLPYLGTNGRTLILVGRCAVDYQGRARSRLGPGDRIVLVKSDGTLLIHNPDGLKPVNWQRPGCAFRFRLADDGLVLEARRDRPPEVVQATFVRLDLVGSTRLETGTPLQLHGSEFDVRDALRARPELVEPGFRPWARERLTERGPMDLYGEDAQGRRVVVEVKRGAAGVAEATQLWRYVEREREKREVTVRGILVAPSVSAPGRRLLEDHGLEFRSLRVEDAAPPEAARPQPSLRDYDAASR